MFVLLKATAPYHDGALPHSAAASHSATGRHSTTKRHFAAIFAAVLASFASGPLWAQQLRGQFIQGSQRSISSTSASVTGLDGAPASIQSGVLRPFVIGVTPVVSDAPQIPDVGQLLGQVRGRQLFNLRQSQATVHARRLEQYIRRAWQAESEGDQRMARANYRGAIALAPEPLRTQLRLRLRAFMQSSRASDREGKAAAE